MPLNHSHVLSQINNYLTSSGKQPLENLDPNCGFEQLWSYFSNCTISNDNIYYQHITAIESWYNKLMANSKPFGSKPELKIYHNEFAFHWNFSQDELTNFFATIIETHHAQNINLADKIILISDFSQIFALVYKDNEFYFYDPVLKQAKELYNISPLTDEIFSILAREAKLNEYICAISIEIYSVLGIRSTENLPEPTYPDIKNLYQTYFNQRVDKLQEINARKINKDSIEKFKLWAYYAELTANPYIRNMLINAKLSKYGLEYKDLNTNDEASKQKTLQAVLLHSYISTQLIFDNTAIANAIELSLRIDGPTDLEEKIKQEPALLNAISKVYEATPLMQAAYLHKNRALQKLIENGARTELQNKNGLTAVSFAILANNHEGVALLLKAGATTNSSSYSFLPLTICVELNQLAILKILLENGNKSDLINATGFTALHLASKRGKTQFVRLLLQNNANPNCRTANMFTPLHTTILSWTDSHKVVLQLLLSNNADPNLVDEEKNTALHLAAKHGNDQATKLLLAHNINIDEINAVGNTAIHEAVLNGHYQVFRILLKAQANLNIANNKGETVLSIVAGKYFSHEFLAEDAITIIEQLLINGADLNIVQDDQPILFKVMKCFPLYSLLIKYGANQNISNKNGETALHLAVEHGYSAVIREYLKQNVSIEQKTILGETALHYAVEFRKNLIAELLLKAGADVNAKTTKGETALHLAAQAGLIKLLELLIDNGAQVNSVDNEEMTPLHYAARSGYGEACSFLIARGANIDLMGQSACTPLMVAYYNGHLDVSKMLIEHDPKSPFGYGLLGGGKIVLENEPDSPIAQQLKERIKQITTVDLGNLGIMLLSRDDKKLDANNLQTNFFAGFVYTADELYQKIKEKTDPLVRNFELRRLFYSSIVYGRTDVCEKLLVEKLVDVDGDQYLKEKLAFAPIDAAIFYGRTAIFQLLKEHGADLGIKKQTLYTALYRAIHYRRMDLVKILQTSLNSDYLFAAITAKDEEAVEIVLAQGIDVNAIDKHSNTALYVSVDNQQEGIAKILLDKGADPNLNKMENYSLYCPVYIAADYGQVTLYRMLLEHGAKLNLVDDMGNTFIDDAIRGKDKAVCELFLQHGIDANSETANDLLLMSAIRGNDNTEALGLDDLFGGFNSKDYKEELGGLEKLFSSNEDVTRLNNVCNSMFKDSPFKDNSLDICELLLQYGANPNLKDKCNSTPIYQSVMANSLAVFKLLLHHGAKIDFKVEGHRLISMAIENKSIGILKILLEEKSKVTETSFPLENLWKKIIKVNNPQIYKLLLEQGINVNALLSIDLVRTNKVSKDKLPKILSKLYLNNAVVLADSEKKGTKKTYFIKERELICNRDGSPKWIEIKSKNPKSICANNLDLDMMLVSTPTDAEILALIEEALIKAGLQSLNNKTHVILLAMQQKNEEVIKILLDNGAELQITDVDGRSLLHLAIINDLYSVAKKLITQGININVLDCKGYTPLGLAVLYGKKKFCKLLLESSAQPDLCGTNACTPLQVAYLYGYKDIAKLLIKNNADLNIEDRDLANFPYKDNLPGDKEIYGKIFTKELMPLDKLEFTKDNLLIMHSNDEAICKLLLDWEKTATTAKKHKLTALHIAASCGLVNVCKLLLEKPVDQSMLLSTFGTPLTVAVTHGYLDLVKLFIKNETMGIVTNLNQLMFIALEHKRKDIIKYLATENSTIDAVNKDGLTMLALAVQNGWEEMVKFLIKLGADVNFNIKDITSLHIAVQNDHLHIVKLLLKHKAKFNIIDANNKTAIDVAINKGNDLIYEVLLKEKAHGQQLLH